MPKRLSAKMNGYVLLELRGERIETFLNEAVRAGLNMWDVRLRGVGRGELYLRLADFPRLRPLLKQTGCRMHVVKRYGLPFFLQKVWRRKGFVIGAAGFLLALFILTSLVWTVKVEGNDKLAQEDILKAAQLEGIRPLQWTFRLKEMDELARSLQRRLPDTSWIGVERTGTTVRIRIVESVQPERRDLVSPRHLLADKNALVTRLEVEKGKPVVLPNTYVRKGQVLVSGALGDETHRQLVPATGRVYGLVWYETTVSVPRLQIHRTYTGLSHNRSYLVLGTRALQLSGYGKGYTHSVAIGEPKMLHFGKWVLPVGWLKEQVKESEEREYTLSAAEAKARGLTRARGDLLRNAGEGARIAGEHVLEEKPAAGQLVLRVLYEVEEEITREQAVVELEQAPQPSGQAPATH